MLPCIPDTSSEVRDLIRSEMQWSRKQEKEKYYMADVKNLNIYKTISLVTLPWIRLIWSGKPSTAIETVKFSQYLALQTTVFQRISKEQRQSMGLSSSKFRQPAMQRYPPEWHIQMNSIQNHIFASVDLSWIKKLMNRFHDYFFRHANLLWQVLYNKNLIEFNEIDATAKS